MNVTTYFTLKVGQNESARASGNQILKQPSNLTKNVWLESEKFDIVSLLATVLSTC